MVPRSSNVGLSRQKIRLFTTPPKKKKANH